MGKVPVVDMKECTDCESCLHLCPEVFKRNEETGYIEIIALDQYPEEDIQEVMNCCPKDCVTWEESH
jgi:ferredoxin